MVYLLNSRRPLKDKRQRFVHEKGKLVRTVSLGNVSSRQLSAKRKSAFGVVDNEALFRGARRIFFCSIFKTLLFALLTWATVIRNCWRLLFPSRLPVLSGEMLPRFECPRAIAAAFSPSPKSPGQIADSSHS
jgi:hypothetical protein